MARFNSKLGIGSLGARKDRRRRTRLEQATFGTVEALERRVLMSNITIQVLTHLDNHADSTVSVGKLQR